MHTRVVVGSPIESEGGGGAGAAAAAATRPAVLRGALVLGCGAAMLGASLGAHPDARYLDDAELGRLLRAMALLKATLVLAALPLLWWRFGWPSAALPSALYLGSTWLAAGACVWMWQLHQMALAAGVFHAGLLAFLLAALVDARSVGGWPRRAVGRPGP